MKEGDMAEDVIRARRIELLDEDGNVSVVLEGEAEGRAGLLISTPEAGAPTTTIGIDRASGNPFIYMHSGGEASIFATFDAGEASVRLTNEDGARLTITP
jgi:hypothetical protein